MESTKYSTKIQQPSALYNDEFFAILTTTRRLTAQLKFIGSTSQLNSLKKNIDECFATRKETLAVEEEENFAKIAKIEKVKKMMEEQGLTLEDINGGQPVAPVAKRPYKKREGNGHKHKMSCNSDQIVQSDGTRINPSLKAKYEYTTADGSKQTWHGKGKRPKRLKQLVAGGLKIESFLIKETEGAAVAAAAA